MIADLFATPHPDNLAWKIAENLLPDTTATAFTTAMSTFAGSLAFFGSLFVGFGVLVGIVHSAYSGKVLGEKYHQIFAPLRVIIGFGGMVAVTATGLSPVHKAEKAGYQIGVNMGDAAAVAGVEYVVKDGHSLTPVSAGGRQLAWNIVTSEVCAEIYTQAASRSAYNDGWKIPVSQPALDGRNIIRPARKGIPIIGTDTPAKLEGIAWDYGQPCGSFTFSFPSSEEFGTFGQGRRKAVHELLAGVRNLAPSGGIAKMFEKAGVTEFTDPTSPTGGDLDKIDYLTHAGVLVPDLVKQVNALGDAFDVAVENSAAAISAAENKEHREKLVEGVKTHGWMILGSYYRMLSSISAKASTYASERAIYTAPNPDAWGAWRAEVGAALALIEAQNQGENNRLIVDGDDLAGVADESGLLAKIVNKMTLPLVDYLTSYDQWRPDPIGDMINSGHRMLTSAEIGFGAGLAATGAANFWSSTAGKVVDFMMVPGWWLIGAAWVAGVLMVYVLPLIPYIYMIFAAGALAMELLVFSIAGLIWCFAHLRMDGDDLVNSAQSLGYTALFSLVLRQPITVLGYFGANAIGVVLLNIFLMTWNFSFKGSQGNATVGIIGVLLAYAMMFLIQWHIYLRLFALILELPSRCAAYLGASIPGWNEGEHGHAVIASVGGQVQGARPGKPVTGGKKEGGGGDDNGGRGRGENGVSARGK